VLIGPLQIHHVESEQWLGALIHANDELVTALMTFEQVDRSINADSDSEDEAAEQAHIYRSELRLFFYLDLSVLRMLIGVVAAEKGKDTAGASNALAGLHIGGGSSSPRPKAPPRPVRLPADDDSDEEVEEDEDDPFADRNAV
jgi:LAS seventeen-binding protein 5